MRERLQKIIARAGLSSRRAAEELVTAGRVRVNGRVVTELGAQADLHEDRVEVDGKRITPTAPVYLVMHKPKNVVSTLSDPEGRATVAELLRGADERVHPVGRLDYATSGVLLATNDGEFTQAMLHPRKEVPKTYVVKALGVMTDDDLAVWRQGVRLEDGVTAPARTRLIRYDDGKTWFELTIHEGRNQQVRRMGDATGFRVMRLARVSFAGITHEGLRPGDWRPLTADELKRLREEYGVPKRVPRSSPRSEQAVRAPRGRAGASTPRRARASSESPRAKREGERPSGASRSTKTAARGQAKSSRRS
jgi:23S rRNA pseudouridine2605 synthase